MARPRPLDPVLDRERLDRYICATATGYFGAPSTRGEALGEYGEAPRALPELTAAIVVDTALRLLRNADKVLHGEWDEDDDEDDEGPCSAPLAPDVP